MTVNHLLWAFLVVLAISVVFSMFGKGGGSLYTPVLVMLGWEINSAISTALFLNVVTAGVATVVFARSRLVDFKFASIFLPGTIAGSTLGAVTAQQIHDEPTENWTTDPGLCDEKLNSRTTQLSS